MNKKKQNLIIATSNRTVEGIEAGWEWLTENPHTLPRVRYKLINYFTVAGRDLPWRRTSDPYKVFVAEILLQKTGSKPVIKIWEEFIRRYSSIQSLAIAQLSDLEHLLKPLGLRKRAAILINAAKIITKKYSGIIPNNEKDLTSLPGIGRYTSAAILSFAFGVKAPTIDINSARVYTRIGGFLPRTLRQGTEYARLVGEELISEIDHRIINLSVLDLAAQICKPKPKCLECPILEECIFGGVGILSKKD